jgi:hypothetical protein
MEKLDLLKMKVSLTIKKPYRIHSKACFKSGAEGEKRLSDLGIVATC